MYKYTKLSHIHSHPHLMCTLLHSYSLQFLDPKTTRTPTLKPPFIHTFNPSHNLTFTPPLSSILTFPPQSPTIKLSHSYSPLVHSRISFSPHFQSSILIP